VLHQNNIYNKIHHTFKKHLQQNVLILYTQQMAFNILLEILN
jgi:hypothetical protein